jgi:hypothetical protein
LKEELMSRSEISAEKPSALATHNDVRDVLGKLDDDKMVAIMALKPTIVDIEEASMWLSGDADVFGPGRALKDVAARIVTLLKADEEGDAWRAR